LAEAHQRAQEGLATGARPGGLQPGGAVELDDVDLEAGQVFEVRRAGAEVVEADQEAPAAEALEEGVDGDEVARVGRPR
jgi:hypothetical protein